MFDFEFDLIVYTAKIAPFQQTRNVLLKFVSPKVVMDHFTNLIFCQIHFFVRAKYNVFVILINQKLTE